MRKPGDEHREASCAVSYFRWTAVALAYGHLPLSKRAHKFTAWHHRSRRRAGSCLQGYDAHHLCLESDSARSREAVIGERKTGTGTDGVMKDARQVCWMGEWWWWEGSGGMAHGSDLCSLLHRSFSLLYLTSEFVSSSPPLCLSFTHCLLFLSLSFFEIRMPFFLGVGGGGGYLCLSPEEDIFVCLHGFVQLLDFFVKLCDRPELRVSAETVLLCCVGRG